MQAEQRTTLLEDYAWKRPRSTSHGPSSTDRRARARDWNTTKMTMLPLNPFVRRVDNKSPPPTSPVRSPRKRRRAKSHLNTPSTSSSSLFGEYTVKCPLRNAAAAAGGGGASLFIAKSRLTSEEVVLKMIDKTLAKKKVVRQLKKEALVMACLQHFEEANRTRLAEGGVKEKEEKKARRNEAKKKRIVPLLQVVEDTQCLCLVMPLAQAGDLFDYISSNRGLPREEAWRIFEQLVEGLSFAHSCGFIHRDIKPENIFLDADGDVLIGDWGYGTHWSSLSLKNRSCGSPNYVAGELLREAAYVGPEVDVFSLGVVFYACLTGNLPFGNSKRPDYAQRVKQGDWNDHPVLTPVERKLLDAMFHPDPLRRATIYDVAQYIKEWRKCKRDCISSA